MATRAALIALPDTTLEAQCDVDRYRASGPGGQHRNKTESAIRLRHRPSGVTVHADESRSQAENRVRAVRRLREALALSVREPVALDGWAPSAGLRALVDGGVGRLGEKTRQTGGFLTAFAELLDLFDACGAEVALTAGRLGMSTGACSKLLLVDDHTARTVNQMRGARGLRPLR